MSFPLAAAVAVIAAVYVFCITGSGRLKLTNSLYVHSFILLCLPNDSCCCCGGDAASRLGCWAATCCESCRHNSIGQGAVLAHPLSFCLPALLNSSFHFDGRPLLLPGCCPASILRCAALRGLLLLAHPLLCYCRPYCHHTTTISSGSSQPSTTLIAELL